MKPRYQQTIITVLLVVIFSSIFFVLAKHNMAAVTASISDRPVTIVIDAGHGGEDGGAIGIDGIPESHINLSISLRLEQLLSFCGYQTHMIRSADTAVYSDGDTISERKMSDLKNRVSIVNSIDPAILISIHQNHFSQEKYFGAQVFYSKSTGSKELAENIQNSLRQALDPENHRECKQSESVYLMERICCPGVLIECGFLSNETESVLLQQPAYQKQIVSAITCALSQYMSKGADKLEV